MDTNDNILKNAKPAGTIDCTPSWTGTLNALLILFKEEKDIAFVKSEFLKMAKAADNWAAHCKTELTDEELVAKARQLCIDRKWNPDSMETRRVAKEIINAFKEGYKVRG